MLKNILWFTFAAIALVLVVIWAGKAEYDRCMAAGKQLGAKAVVVGNKCMIEGYGRL